MRVVVYFRVKHIILCFGKQRRPGKTMAIMALFRSLVGLNCLLFFKEMQIVQSNNPNMIQADQLWSPRSFFYIQTSIGRQVRYNHTDPVLPLLIFQAFEFRQASVEKERHQIISAHDGALVWGNLIPAWILCFFSGWGMSTTNMCWCGSSQTWDSNIRFLLQMWTGGWWDKSKSMVLWGEGARKIKS